LLALRFFGLGAEAANLRFELGGLLVKQRLDIDGRLFLGDRLWA
jgi:hypothetical protein